MAACPQGWTDVEWPTEFVTFLVATGYAWWDAEDGVHKLTPEGYDFAKAVNDRLAAA